MNKKQFKDLIKECINEVLLDERFEAGLQDDAYQALNQQTKQIYVNAFKYLSKIGLGDDTGSEKELIYLKQTDEKGNLSQNSYGISYGDITVSIVVNGDDIEVWNASRTGSNPRLKLTRKISQYPIDDVDLTSKKIYDVLNVLG